MTIIQSATVKLSGVNSTSAHPALAGVVAGNTLVWVTNTFNTSDKVPTDSAGQTWSKAKFYNPVAPHECDIGVYYLLNANAGTHTLSWLVGDAPNGGYLFGALTECPPSSGLDVAGSGTVNSGGNPTSISASVTTSAASTFEFASMCIGSNSGNTNCNISNPPSGWTAVGVSQNSSADQAAEICYKEQTSAGTQTANWTFTADPTSADVSALAVSFVMSGGGSGSFGTAETTTGTTVQDTVLTLTAPAAESSIGTTAQTALATLTVGSDETTLGTTAQTDTVSLSSGISETSVSTTTQDATVTIASSIAESSAGTTAQDSTIALTIGITESSIGTTAQDAPSSGSGTFGTTEVSVGTATQTAAVSVPTSVAESNAGTTTQNSSVTLTKGVAETSAGATVQDQTGSQTFSVAESSAGTTTQTGTVGAAISRGVTEASAGTTAQGVTIAPPTGNGASAVRRWLIQYYTDYQEKRKKDEAIKELSKEVLQASAGVVTPKMVRERAPTPVVILTPGAASLDRKAQQLREERRIQAQIAALVESQKALATMPSLRVDDLHLRFEQGEEEDLLLLSSIL